MIDSNQLCRVVQHLFAFVALRCALSIAAAALFLPSGCNSSAATGTKSVAPAVVGNRAPNMVSLNAAVAADHPTASQAGLDMLLAGGNAVDAAVATSFCLSVVRPYACGIGGGGFMMIYMPAESRKPAKSVALVYRETAPNAVGPDYYIKLKDAGDAPSQFGVHAVATPGTVRGLLYALEHYGTLDRATALAPAIVAAENGFVADAAFVNAVSELEQLRAENPQIAASSQYIWETVCLRGSVQSGDVVRNPQQADALRLIAAEGDAAFYSGAIGSAIAEIIGMQNGPLTSSDLANYSMRIEAPLHGEFLGRDLRVMPPPSSGGIAILQITGMIERRLGGFSSDATAASPARNVNYLQVLTEAMKHAFADRSRWLADDDFEPVPIAQLLDDEYIDELAARIDLNQTMDQSEYGSKPDDAMRGTLPRDAGTSHFSVIDSQGMAVACTETINLTFGSCVEVPGFGFMLNNEMDDFSTHPGAGTGTEGANAFGLVQSDRNAPQPGMRPLSSMSPTIVLKDGRVEFIAGASGGPRIITATVQSLLNAMVFDMLPSDAVGAPRVHHQWSPNVLQFEFHRFDPMIIEAMKQRGHETSTRDSVGIVQMIGVYVDGIRAASDPRGGGEPAGY